MAWHGPTPNSHWSQAELLTGFKKGELGVSGDHGYKYLEGWHKKEQNNDPISYSGYEAHWICSPRVQENLQQILSGKTSAEGQTGPGERGRTTESNQLTGND